jgi:hypothetical protein
MKSFFPWPDLNPTPKNSIDPTQNPASFKDVTPPKGIGENEVPSVHIKALEPPK